MKNISKNSVWVLLFTLLVVSFLWFFVPAASNLYRYISLSATKEAFVSNWFVEEVSPGEFRIGASYFFTANGKQHQNETIFTSPKFRNPASADDELKKRGDKVLAFYSPQNEDFSSLQNPFPLKECISALILLFLMFYFAGLKIYGEKKFNL
ncbi:MAG TPA: hypothetical protein PLC42_01940 [Parachlamydiaceae bacterium]|nr:hypothetical protein [Parachlamydiaceae bacterium]